MPLTVTDWHAQSQDYRRGWIEGHDAEIRDAYLLETGVVNSSEYLRGFNDGINQRTKEEKVKR